MSIFDHDLVQAQLSMGKMRRTFHPVGQGAFYTETFILGSDQYHTVVYDCGVSGDTASINTCLESLGKTYGNNIDIVFISHFHADHISHIPILLEKFNVKAIVLPDVTPEVAVDAFMNNYIASGRGNNAFDTHLIDRLLSSESGIDGTKVIQVDQLGIEGDNIVGNNNILDCNEGNLDNRPAYSKISSDTIIRLFGWEYILCNYPCAHASKLVDEMRKSFPTLLEVLMRREWVEARALLNTITFDKIAQLYKECFRNDENEESMTVLSRPINDYFKPSACCLYTGDSPFRTKRRLNYVKTYYNNHWDKIGTMQAPHHGADADNPSELHDKYRTCVACYGTKNTYGHPGKQALINMAKAKCNIRLVTEELTSGFEKYIQYL